MTCPVPGCAHHHVYSTAGNLAAHTLSVHGWTDPFDTRLQAYLEPFGFTQCGRNCSSGAGVGASWLRFSVRCNVPTQHLDCPHYAQHKHRHEHRVLLGKEATKVLPLLELRKNDGEDSLAFHVRAVVEQMRGGAVAGTEVATARRLKAMLASKFVGRPASDLPSHVTQLQANILQCSKLLREPVPQVSRAMRALGRGQRFDVRSEADQALVQSLFPQGDALPPPSFAETRWAAPRIDEDAVNRLIKRKDSLSAAGLSGHGIKAMKGLRKRGRHWVTALRLVSQAVADCWFTGTEAEDAVAACALTLVAKPGGGKPRPIGVGEAVVNLARTVAAGALLRQIQASHPLDFGLASTCGTDACVALVRAKLRAGPGNVAILLDFSNAFGSLSRVAILKGALQYCPQAVPLLRAAYATDGLAYYALANGETASLRATRGVRQGDSLGPLLFMLGIMPLLEDTRAHDMGATLSSYLDDVQQTGPELEALESFKYLQARLEPTGLSLNPSKCRVLAPAGLSDAARGLYAQAGLTEVVDSAGLLGSHIGRADSTLEFLRDQLITYRQRLDAVCACKDAGVSVQRLYKVLHYCCMASVAHLFRSMLTARSLKNSRWGWRQPR